jgi:holo-[acyl-carrier-protein] synthase
LWLLIDTLVSVDDEGVVAEAVEIVAIAAEGCLSQRDDIFTDAELAYARSKSDPERRLAARLAAKRATLRLLESAAGAEPSPALGLRDVEVVRGRGGPPRIRLSARAEECLKQLGAQRVLASLSHVDAHAAAAVLLLREA